MNRRKILTVIASLLLVCAFYAQAQSKAPSGGVIRREGEPDCVHITEDNQAINRAVETAQKTVNEFIGYPGPYRSGGYYYGGIHRGYSYGIQHGFGRSGFGHGT